MKEEFTINFDELAFLVEACIPPKPIARTMFWKKVIDEYFHQFNWQQRMDLLDWLRLNPTYKEGLKNQNKEILYFDARFDPNNQYKVYTHYNNKKEVHECFLLNGLYYIEIDKSILPEYITKV